MSLSIAMEPNSLFWSLKLLLLFWNVFRFLRVGSRIFSALRQVLLVYFSSPYHPLLQSTNQHLSGRVVESNQEGFGFVLEQ
jgi:hypothetical protein